MPELLEKTGVCWEDVMVQNAYHCQLKQPRVTQNMSYLPSLIEVLQPQVVRSDGLGQGPKVILAIGAVAEQLGIKAAVKEPLATAGCCLPGLDDLGEQGHLQEQDIALVPLLAISER